jgi:hypothetical protein
LVLVQARLGFQCLARAAQGHIMQIACLIIRLGPRLRTVHLQEGTPITAVYCLKEQRSGGCFTRFINVYLDKTIGNSRLLISMFCDLLQILNLVSSHKSLPLTPIDLFFDKYNINTSPKTLITFSIQTQSIPHFSFN